MISENVSSADNQQERALLVDVRYLSYYLAGFADGEGCFSVSIQRRKTKLCWYVNPFFQVYQHKDNAYVLHVFKKILKCGYISEKGGNPACHVYCVDKLDDLITKIIPFFEKHKLIGEKYNNFLIFKEVIRRMQNKEHLTSSGFEEIVKLIFTMNKNGRYRKISLNEILSTIGQSSETKRQTLSSA